MADLSYAQLKAVWLSASKGTKYHTNAWASLMAAIAMAESGGNQDALNPNDNNGTQTSWGLWQISNGTHNSVSPNWNNPEVNAKLALGKLESQGLDAWGTYTSGAYKAFLSDKTAADGANIPSGGGTVTAAQLTAFTQGSTTCLIPNPLNFLTAAVAEGAAIGGILGALIGAITGSSGGSQSGACLLSKTEARAVAGAALLVAGGGMMGGGVVLLIGIALADEITRLVRSVMSGAPGKQAPAPRLAGP
jgi:Lysozyme like domain